ncbi:MAG: type II toxin-antitoxin system PemK/MazF family toxin [Balneolales bacterium]
MPYEKRQIIEAHFEGNAHPAVIISANEVYLQERYYICAMLTSSNSQDRFSFNLRDGDTIKPLTKETQVRLQLIGIVKDEEIIRNNHHNSLTVEAFDRLIDSLAEKVFGVAFM